jgi:hypothetical protein
MSAVVIIENIIHTNISSCILQSNSSFTNISILYCSGVVLREGSLCSLAYTRAKFTGNLYVVSHSDVRFILTGTSSMEFDTLYCLHDSVPLIFGDAGFRVTGNLSGYSVKDMIVIPDSFINR